MQTQLFHLVFTEPGPRGLADPCMCGCAFFLGLYQKSMARAAATATDGHATRVLREPSMADVDGGGVRLYRLANHIRLGLV